MPIVRFFGKVSPVEIPVNFPIVERMNWGSEDLGFPIIMSSRILNSNVEVICDVERYEDSFLSTLLARALNLVHGCVDLAAFATGVGLSLEFHSVLRPDGWADALVKTNPELGALCTCCKVSVTTQQERNEFNRTLSVVFRYPTILASLNDLAKTLTNFHETPTNCGRVLDSIRKDIAPQLDRKQGWVKLQETINTDGNYMDWVSKYSTETRHGERVAPIPKLIIDEIRARTWQVMNRFIEYKKSGESQLSLSAFPLLIHDPAFPFPKP